MIVALLACFRSMAIALRRGRLLAAIALAQLVIALPVVSSMGRALRDGMNHRVDAQALGSDLDFTTWFDLRGPLASAEPAMLASAFGAFLLGVFLAGGWLELLSRRERPSGVRVFMAGAAGRFFRFLRLACIALVAIAAASWLFYGEPMKALLRARIGSDDLADFSSESSMRAFVTFRSIAFASCVALVVLCSDLGRAVLTARGGNSALIAAMRGAWLFVRRPASSLVAAGAPFVIELLALAGVAWWIDGGMAAPPSTLNLIVLFSATQVAVVIREVTRAGRLGALLAVVHRDTEMATERRYGKQENVPFVAAAGQATTG